MMGYVLLVISVVIVLLNYLMVIVSNFNNRIKKIEDYTGFEVAKEVTSNYDAINIVRSNDIVISEYDIKRNVIRLNNSNYDGNSYYDIFVSILLAGYSLLVNWYPNEVKIYV